MDKESFDHGNGMCFLCKCFLLPHEDAFFHGAPFHVECLNQLGNGWMEVLEPNPVPFFIWLMNHYNGVVEVAVVNGEFQLYVADHWWMDDPFIDVIDDADWPDENDPEWEEVEAEADAEFEGA